MSNKAKISTVIVGFVLLVAGVFVWTQYGEYDRRDIPSEILFRAKTFDGYHLNVHVTYDYSRDSFLCNGFGGHGYDAIDFNDVSPDGVLIPIKRKWPGICKPEFELISITCVENALRNVNANTTGKIWLSGDSSGQLFGKKMTIEKNDNLSRITECDFNCDNEKRIQSFQINKSVTEIEITCKKWAWN